MMQEEIIPLDEEFHEEVGKEGDRFAFTARQTEILTSLQNRAREEGLWNFWLTMVLRVLSGFSVNLLSEGFPLRRC
ncbi:MAG: hypothetical protein AAF197_09790, partial [Pseudomonadota bacterium]